MNEREEQRDKECERESFLHSSSSMIILLRLAPILPSLSFLCFVLLRFFVSSYLTGVGELGLAAGVGEEEHAVGDELSSAAGDGAQYEGGGQRTQLGALGHCGGMEGWGRWMDGWVDGSMDGWIDGWVDG